MGFTLSPRLRRRLLPLLLIFFLLGLIFIAYTAGTVLEGNFRAEVIRLVNEEREKENLPPLVEDSRLAPVAELRAAEAAKEFSHTRPDGSPWKTAFVELGVEASFRGENLAYGQRTPERVVEAWMRSKGHRENILHERFTAIAIGLYEADGVLYWSQIFMEAPDDTAASTLPELPPFAEDVLQRAHVDDVDLNLRAKPNSKAAILSVIPRGAVVSVLEHGDGWSRVRMVDGTEGWASRKYLRMEAPPAAPIDN